jgi:hypothetical protein
MPQAHLQHLASSALAWEAGWRITSRLVAKLSNLPFRATVIDKKIVKLWVNLLNISTAGYPWEQLSV